MGFSLSPSPSTQLGGCSRAPNASNRYCVVDDDEDSLRIKTTLRKIIWDFGFSCFLPAAMREPKHVIENNRAWLLADSGPELTSGDPQSVQSSFRFSLVELESLNKNLCTSNGATVLLVNLDSGLDQTDSHHLQCQRIQSLEKSISPVTGALTRFNYGDILSATRNFSKGRVLGRGAWSCVFRGRVGLLRTAVAIKRLDMEDKESPKAFCRELMIASSLDHPNVVPLLGFCIDPQEGLFLVYKYVSGGSLERHLHVRKNKKGNKIRAALGWSVRYKVAVGTAEAIMYLHNGTEQCVVHRDIKPSNILLSSNKTPKLCDFGLASWTSAPSVPLLCKTVKGTFGYLAPEYFQHGKVSDRTDVYAFGVVLLELLTGRKPIDANMPSGQENLVQWAKPLLQMGIGGANELVDPRLKCKTTLLCSEQVQVERMIQAADACINTEEFSRPTIDKIVAILRGEEEEEEESSSQRWSCTFSGNGCCNNTQSQQTNSEMKSHLALAMLGVSEFEEDYQHFSCR